MGSLSIVDYVIFALMLAVCGAIGIYHAIRSKEQQTTENFLMANHSMGKFPIAMSLLVSFVSAIAILGIPSEVYTYGLSYVLVSVAMTIVMLTSAFLYVPVFYKLKITSTNEYLEKRFTPGLRLVGSILFLLTYTIYLSIALFAPALALETVTGLSMIISIVLNGAVCVFYTSLGGIKAVIWTDVFQGFVIITGMLCIFITGIVEVGGFSNVWRINKEMGRTDIFNFDPDPTIRSTFWTFTVGGVFTYLYSWSVSQLSVQRFLATKSLKEAQEAVLINIPVFIFIAVICSLDGLVIFAVYHDCDLAKEKKVTRNDQILPFFVVDKLGYLTGVPGLFIASLFSGSLSTVSSGINSLTAIALEDIIKNVKSDIPDSKATFLSKIMGVIYGIIVILVAVGLGYAKVPLLIQLTASLFNISAGPLLGLFTLGMLSKRANWKGAYIGTLCSFVMVGWIYIGSMYYPPNVSAPPISVKNCVVFNATKNNISNVDGLIYRGVKEYSDPLAGLYGLSFLYYGAVGMLVTIIVGLLFSFILETSVDRQTVVDTDLLFNIHMPRFNTVRSERNSSHTATPDIQKSHPNCNVSTGKENIPMESSTNGGFAHDLGN